MRIDEMDLIALEGYANALESFKSRVNKYCNDFEAGIVNCSQYMLDAHSRNALQKGHKAAADIKACLYPAERLLDKVNDAIDRIKTSGQDIEVDR